MTRFSFNGKYVRPVTRQGHYEIVKENDNNYLLDTGTVNEWFPKSLCKPVYWCIDCKHIEGSTCTLHNIEKAYEYEKICDDLTLKIIEPKSNKPERWNPDHFGSLDFKSEVNGQLTIFAEPVDEPPEPDDFNCFEAYDQAWQEWEVREQERKEQKVREQEVREQEVREQEVREQEVREQEVREQELRDQEVREQELRDQEVREQQDSDRRLMCSLTPPQTIIDKARSKRIKGTFDLKEIKNNLYWYVRYREDGRLKSVYLGKAQPGVREQNS